MTIGQSWQRMDRRLANGGKRCHASNLRKLKASFNSALPRRNLLYPGARAKQNVESGAGVSSDGRFLPLKQKLPVTIPLKSRTFATLQTFRRNLSKDSGYFESTTFAYRMPPSFLINRAEVSDTGNLRNPCNDAVVSIIRPSVDSSIIRCITASSKLHSLSPRLRKAKNDLVCRGFAPRLFLTPWRYFTRISRVV